MALIKCPECGNDVSTEAEACPKCGCPIKKQESYLEQNNDIQPIKQSSSTKGSGCATIAIIILLLIVGLVLFGQCGGSSSKSDNWNTESWAKSYAQLMVKNNLKAPSTAKFCNSAREMNAKNLGGTKWKVTGWVDAQNSFGAMIRSDFEVTLELTKDGAKCIDCVIKAR